MAKRGPHSFAKRQREVEKKRRAQEKRDRRAQRKEQKANGVAPIPLEGVEAGVGPPEDSTGEEDEE